MRIFENVLNGRPPTHVQTIQFNTGRKYTAEGQVVVATLHDDGVVTFMDHSRQVHGEFDLLESRDFTEAEVMRWYDSCRYRNSTRAWTDGMTRGGCNSRRKS